MPLFYKPDHSSNIISVDSQLVNDIAPKPSVVQQVWSGFLRFAIGFIVAQVLLFAVLQLLLAIGSIYAGYIWWYPITLVLFLPLDGLLIGIVVQRHTKNVFFKILCLLLSIGVFLVLDMFWVGYLVKGLPMHGG